MAEKVHLENVLLDIELNYIVAAAEQESTRAQRNQARRAIIGKLIRWINMNTSFEIFHTYKYKICKKEARKDVYGVQCHFKTLRVC